MNTKQLALDHYDRMIAWAEKQPKSDSPQKKIMESAIDEWWGPEYCPYCILYNWCDGCPLDQQSCCGHTWLGMHFATTWGEWVSYAKKIKKFIEVNG